MPMLARRLRSFKSGERSISPTSEPVDLTGMSPEEVKPAVRAAARTMKLPKPFTVALTLANKKETKKTDAKPDTANPAR